jgi:DNA-directed RNA polymerase subunit RPC12/RpoP
MYYLIYKRWTISVSKPDAISVLSFENEEDLSEHIESLEVNELGVWNYEIIAIIKGERLDMKSQQKFLFEIYQVSAAEESCEKSPYKTLLVCHECNYSAKLISTIAIIDCPKCGSDRIVFRDIL